MSALPISQNPELEALSMEVGGTGKTLKTWSSYRMNSHLLCPTDGWTFEVEVSEISDALRSTLIPGAEVALKINDSIQSTGYIDSVEIDQTPEGGTRIVVEGRDKLAYAVDSQSDFHVHITAQTTIKDFLLQVFKPFGFEDVDADTATNRSVKTRENLGVRLTKKHNLRKSDLAHVWQPYMHEGAYEFAARVCERNGFFIWPSADGKKIVVGQPDFDSPAVFKLRRKIGQAAGSSNNILHGNVKRDLTDQPTIIFAYAYTAGGEFDKSFLRGAIVNPLLDSPDTPTLLAKYPGMPMYSLDPSLEKQQKLRVLRGRPLYLPDSAAKTSDELGCFLRREMSLRLRKSLVCRYVVAGHVQFGVDDLIWNADTMVDVQDDVCGINEKLYVLSRTFVKSVRGTFTELELVKPYTVSL